MQIEVTNVPGNKVNLCDSCSHDYPKCPSSNSDILFGDGKGNDNIACCATYLPHMVKVKKEETNVA